VQLTSIVILFVRASALKNNIARYTIFDGEPELRLVQDIFLRSEIDKDGHGHKFFLFIILGDWKGIQALWKFSEWQRLTS
jgi:hypothetical protein